MKKIISVFILCSLHCLTINLYGQQKTQKNQPAASSETPNPAPDPLPVADLSTTLQSLGESQTCPKDIAGVNVKDKSILFFDLPDSHDLQLAIVLPAANRKGADKKYVLHNLNSDAVYTGTLNDSVLTFLISGKEFEGDAFFLQMTSPQKDKCYSFLAKITLNTAPPLPPPVKAPPINLDGLTPVNTEPCTSCNPEGHFITYDFSKNSLKNRKAGGQGKPDKFDNGYLASRWTYLPRVGQAMTFEVVNVNPFKYDITVSNTLVSLNVEAPAALLNAVTLASPNVSGAAALVEDKDKPTDEKALFKAMMDVVDSVLSAKTSEFEKAGDCFNPCEYITPIVQKICAYFQKNSDFKYGSFLETYLLAKIKTLYDPGKDKKDIAEFTAIVAKLKYFQSVAYGNYSYRIPQIHNVDQYVFKLNIIPKEGIAAGARVVDQDIAVDILGGFKVDVTSGLFVSDLVDHRYILRADSSVVRTSNGFDDSIVYNRRNRVLRETAHSRDFGVASFLHFYPKITPSINLSLSLGAALSINDKPRLRYLGGFSLLGGKANRLALTYGWAAGFVDRLSDRYLTQTDATGTIFTPTSDKQVYYKQVFKVRHFVALTFSIPLIRKKESGSDAAPSGSTAQTADASETGSSGGTDAAATTTTTTTTTGGDQTNAKTKAKK